MQNVHFSSTADPVLFSGIDAAIEAALTPVSIVGDPLFVRFMPSTDDLAHALAHRQVCGELAAITRGTVVVARDGREYVMLGYGGRALSPSGDLLHCDVVPVDGDHWKTVDIGHSYGTSRVRIPLFHRTVRMWRADVVPTDRRMRLAPTYRGARFPVWLPDAA